MEKQSVVCVPSEYKNIIAYAMEKRNMSFQMIPCTEKIAKNIPLQKKTEQYDKIASAAPKDDDMIILQRLPKKAKEQIINNLSYIIISDKSEEFILNFCKKIINSKSENEAYFKTWLKQSKVD